MNKLSSKTPAEGDRVRVIGGDRSRICIVLAVKVINYGTVLAQITDGLWGGWIDASHVEVVGVPR